MKTSRLLIGSFILSLALPGSGADAVPPADIGVWCVGTSLAGQTAKSTGSARQRRREVDGLLKRARKAMKAGQRDAADKLIKKAEALDAPYGFIYLGDTPKKARRDLEKMRASANGPKRPSQRFRPSIAWDRFTGSQAADGPAKSDPFAAQAAPSTAPAETSLTDIKSRAAMYVMNGRRELTRGNMAAAKHWYRKAKQIGAAFDADEDSPEKLLADIHRAGGEVAEVPPSGNPEIETVDPPPPGAQLPGIPGGPMRNDLASSPLGSVPTTGRSPRNRSVIDAPPADDSLGRITAVDSGRSVAAGRSGQPSGSLLLSARRALAVGDVSRAASLVVQARQRGERSAFDSPERVKATIQAYQQIQQQRGRGPATPAYRRQLAMMLVQQADALLAYGDFDEAERLASEAGQQGATFNHFELKPADLLQRVAAARSGRGRPHPPASGIAATAAVDPSPAPVAARGVTATVPRDNSPQALRHQAMVMLAEARRALAAGNLEHSERLARQAESLRVPNSMLQQGDDRPWLVLMEIQRLRNSAAGVSQQAASETAPESEPVAPARYTAPVAPATGMAAPEEVRDFPQPQSDGPGTVVPPALETGNSPGPAVPESLAVPTGTPAAASEGHRLFVAGEAAIERQDYPSATRLLLEAYQHRKQLDAPTQKRLASDLSFLSNPNKTAVLNRVITPKPETLIDHAATDLQLAARQLSAELARRQQQARKLRETDPATALRLLQDARQTVEEAKVDEQSRGVLLRRVDRDITEQKQYIHDHQAMIDLDQRNQDTLEEIERERQVKVNVQEKLALLVDQFNQLMDEQRFAEAEIVAKKAQQLSPGSQLATQLVKQSRLIRQWNNQMAILDRKEDGVLGALGSAEESAIPQDDRIPIVFPDAKTWGDLTERRRRTQPGERVRRSEAELKIEQKLRTPVLLQYENAPLGQVMEHLAKAAGVNLHLDLDGLRQEGASTNTPVTINLSEEISLKSALNLILEQLHLSYVIKDEVLKITSEAMRQGDIYTVTYSVADLIVPIPNFSPGNRLGLEGSLANAYSQLGYGGAGMGGFSGAPPVTVLAGNDGGTTNAAIDPSVLAQIGAGASGGGGGGGGLGGGLGSAGFGPGGMGGGANADFDSLIDLITSTVAPQSWEDVGGSGAIESFPTNLSLVISQTEDVHQQIADLLDQLRRLQDLQVTIEVRFITLNDNFFERIGVDFDFDIDDNIDSPFQVFGKPDPNFSGPFDNSGSNPGRNTQDRDHGPSVTVGQSAPGVFSTDLDIPFRQDSFGLAIPQFGGFDATAGAQLGFAILSDLEAFFFINAAEGDRRTNVLQAPKVTLFNGQQAFVADISQSPFVISVIPVVGDFAAAQQPVIVVLNEGTFLTVQAVVSSDRRFVRLTLVPFFSQIGDVNTFRFTGSTTTTDNSSSQGPSDSTTSRDNNNTTVTEGTTVQLPTFAFISVATTVSVPDGGSVLLGGIKRLNEGRVEAGVPILDKMPYVSRLFKNVGIGRETSSLMMMVTPRIIIQEEEEKLLLGGG